MSSEIQALHNGIDARIEIRERTYIDAPTEQMRVSFWRGSKCVNSGRGFATCAEGDAFIAGFDMALRTFSVMP